VAIVSRAFARQAFGEERDAVGRRVRLGRVGSDAPWLSIVGVVGDVRHSEVRAAADPEVYVPLAQAPTDMMMLAARAAARPEDLAGPVRAALARVDPDQPVYHLKTMQALVDEALLADRSVMSLLSLFAALALFLAAIGIYGVVSYGVSQQSRELGVRVALGASPGQLARLVLRRGLSLVAAGAALGVAGALGVLRLLSGMLYGVSASDAATYALACAALLAVAGAACWLPARRAMKVDPIVVLRME
jgi:putative ABC transport system permease protein